MHTQDTYFLELAGKFGVDIKPGEDGACLITVGEDLPVFVRANGQGERMELSAAVAAELPEAVTYSEMMDLLDTALGPLFDAPGIGRDPESGAIILYCILPFASTTPGEFAEAALQFIDLASAFASRLAAMSAADK